MARWAFCTNMAGEFVSLTPDGKEVSFGGASLYLGVKEGETKEKAFASLLSTQSLDRYLPGLKEIGVFAFQVPDKPTDVNLKRVFDAVKKDVESPLETGDRCEWCGEKSPPNGAAKFAHLRKHLNELVRKKKLTEEQMRGVRKLDLPSDIRRILMEYYRK